MNAKRKKFSPEEKARIALEALKGELTLSQITAKYGVHSTQIHNWKQRLKEGINDVFRDKRAVDDRDKDQLIEELYKQIGQLKVEMDWLKKKLSYSISEKRLLIEEAHPKISISQQCTLLGLPRSSYYYSPAAIDEISLSLMRQIDEEFTRHPFIGTRRMNAYLNDMNPDLKINRKRIQHLYRLMDIQAIYQKPNTSKQNKEHKIYPYLLRDVPIEYSNQVWSADITYIPMKQGFLYLVAIIDWYSRYVLTWELSNSLETDFCINALENAFAIGHQCKIFNTDQGCQFTSNAFVGLLIERNVGVSMDGRGRALDNIFIERLWRSVKYECIYLHELTSVRQVYSVLAEYFHYYNNHRFHQSLNYKTPISIYKN